MPTVFRYKGIRFFFYSNEGSPREPLHIHARGNGGDAKIWLFPDARIASRDPLNKSPRPSHPRNGRMTALPFAVNSAAIDSKCRLVLHPVPWRAGSRDLFRGSLVMASADRSSWRSFESLKNTEMKSGGHGMNTSARTVRFDDVTMWVDLSDGRTLGVPLAWFPRLLNATPAQRESVEIGRHGLHWESIDEDISIEGLLAGRGDMTRQGMAALLPA